MMLQLDAESDAVFYYCNDQVFDVNAHGCSHYKPALSNVTSRTFIELIINYNLSMTQCSLLVSNQLKQVTCNSPYRVNSFQPSIKIE